MTIGYHPTRGGRSRALRDLRGKSVSCGGFARARGVLNGPKRLSARRAVATNILEGLLLLVAIKAFAAA